MKNKIFLGLFFLPLICLIAWTLFLTFHRATAPEVRVAIAGYDPTDLLSGHYIQYIIDWKQTDCSQFKNGQCPDPADFCQEARWGRQCRFYIPEEHAAQLDELFRRRSQNNRVFEVVYAYQPGKKALAKKLLIDGQEWQQAL